MPFRKKYFNLNLLKTVFFLSVFLLLNNSNASAMLIARCAQLVNPTPTFVSGNISQNTTWTISNSPYIVTGNLTVDQGSTLTIKPGVNVKFDGNYNLLVNGGLSVEGVDGCRVNFFSNQSSPAAGDWQGIQTEGTSTVNIDYATIKHATKAVFIPTSTPTGQSPTIQNTIININTDGIYFEPSTAPIILNNKIRNNTQYGVFAGCNSFSGCSPLINGNDILNNSTDFFVESYGTNASTLSINAESNWWGSSDPSVFSANITDFLDNVLLPAVNFSKFLGSSGGSPVNQHRYIYGYLDGANVWPQSQGTYIVYGLTALKNDPNASLTIEQGVQVKFETNQELRIEGGTLTVNGITGNEVVFTSNNTTPAAGDWKWIELRSDTSLIKHAVIEYADRGVFIPSTPLGQAPTIENSLFQNNNDGIYFQPSTAPKIVANIITANDDGISAECNAFTGCAPQINGNNILNNTTFNINAFGGAGSGLTIDATDNWWGSNNIPTIEALIHDNADDSGAPIVDYDPFYSASIIYITNNNVVNRFFDPRRSETATIEYYLDTASNVTIEIYDDSQSLVRTLISAQPRSTGYNSEVWDGKNDSSQDLTQGLYTYIITALGTGGEQGLYDPDLEVTYNTSVLNGSITPNQVFSPFKGERLDINYTLDKASLVSLSYGDVDVLTDQPRDSGLNTDAWNGREEISGDIIVQPGLVGLKVYADPLVDNTIAIQYYETFDVTELTTDPYIIRPLNGEVTKITYTTNEQANITVKILSQDGVDELAVLENNVSKAAGTYPLQWDGHTDAGETIAEEGNYRVRVEAVDSFGETIIRDGNIRILF